VTHEQRWQGVVLSKNVFGGEAQKQWLRIKVNQNQLISTAFLHSYGMLNQWFLLG
jgi:hypothetical protein